jgi:hypothetical protein
VNGQHRVGRHLTAFQLQGLFLTALAQVYEVEENPADCSFFSEIISSISDVKFADVRERQHHII